MRRPLLLLPLLALAGCDMAPHYARPASVAPPQWPQGAAYPATAEGTAGLPWQGLVTDTRLRTVIARALADNRDLHAALANVAAARAQYRVARAARLPALAGSAAATVTRGLETSAADAETYSLGAGVSAFEIDLFGRLRNQSKEAFETYLATASGMRATRLTIVAETATAYVTLAADRDMLRIAEAMVASSRRTVELTQSLFRAGLASAGDVESAITTLESAQSDVEQATTQVAQDRNALDLLAGAPVEEGLLPASLADLDGGIALVPAGLSSDVLLNRPDVVEAEHGLKSANAGIGAARAAFFPAISLTSAAGVASTALSALFTGGALNWSVAPSASVPILGGAAKGNLQYAQAQRDYYLAQYEKAVQSAFRDVADGLARRGTIGRQRAAQARLVTAAEKSATLAEAQYQAGTTAFLTVLTAQRTLYAARQTETGAALADLANRIALYQAIGADDSL